MPKPKYNYPENTEEGRLERLTYLVTSDNPDERQIGLEAMEEQRRRSLEQMPASARASAEKMWNDGKSEVQKEAALLQDIPGVLLTAIDDFTKLVLIHMTEADRLAQPVDITEEIDRLASRGYVRTFVGNQVTITELGAQRLKQNFPTGATVIGNRGSLVEEIRAAVRDYLTANTQRV